MTNATAIMFLLLLPSVTNEKKNKRQPSRLLGSRVLFVRWTTQTIKTTTLLSIYAKLFMKCVCKIDISLRECTKRFGGIWKKPTKLNEWAKFTHLCCCFDWFEVPLRIYYLIFLRAAQVLDELHVLFSVYLLSTEIFNRNVETLLATDCLS